MHLHAREGEEITKVTLSHRKYEDRFCTKTHTNTATHLMRANAVRNVVKNPVVSVDGAEVATHV